MMKKPDPKIYGPIVDDDGNLNVGLVKAKIQASFVKGLEKAMRTGSKTITIMHETDPFIEWGQKRRNDKSC